MQRFGGSRGRDSGGRDRPPRVPPALRRQLMLQGVFLILVFGLIVILIRQSGRQDERIQEHVADIEEHSRGRRGAGGEPVETEIGEARDEREEHEDGDGSETLPETSEAIDVEARVAELEPPAAFEDRDDWVAGAALAETRREISTEAVLHLVHKLRARPDALREEPALSTTRGGAWRPLVEDPQLHRGELVELRGNLVAPGSGGAIRTEQQVLLDFPNPAGVPLLWRTYVHDENGRLWMVLLWRREDGEWTHFDGVRLRGYFAQLYSYDMEYRGERRKARIPLLVASGLRTVASPLSSDGSWLVPLFAIALVLPLIAGAVILIVSWRSYRAQRSRTGKRSGARRPGAPSPGTRSPGTPPAPPAAPPPAAGGAPGGGEPDAGPPPT